MSYSPLEPLYEPWVEPTHHRIKPGQDEAVIQPGRRISPCLLVPYIRHQVKQWREADYPGARETTRTLLKHWFDTAHPSGFRYHFAQREAVETIIFLYEVRKYCTPSSMFASLLPDEHPAWAWLSNLPPEDDLWGKYCTKIATGGGKTKVMSLVMAWSFFNAKFENDDSLAKHFVLIAPNLIVFDRLCVDFVDHDIFRDDPVLPPGFADDFNVQVVKQDEPGGGAQEGTIYLTNIHRLYEKDEKDDIDDSPSYSGPKVKESKVYHTGEELRRRISAHPSVMVLNDEAHHLHDPENAWNEAIRAIHSQSQTRGNKGVLAQLDFTATPKHNDGSLFAHITCDFPLGEAVDAGIVKVPVIGRSDEIKADESASDAFGKYRSHLLLGYKQYESFVAEWQHSRKPILFVMTESAAHANEIAKVLNDDERFPLLKNRVLNLHTRLKGAVKTRKRGNLEYKEFVPSETSIKDDDLKWLREESAKLDQEDSPYRCVVSVLMLREGWDVRNVTTIVPLRPYNAPSNILAEQTLGRGLRRMTPLGDVQERVTVVEHPNFTKFYQQELAQEGLFDVTTTLELDKPLTTTIFVDHRNKDVPALDLVIPSVSDSIDVTATLASLEFEEVRDRFLQNFQALPVGKKRSGPITFVERTLFTDEVVKIYELDRGLLAMGSTAVSVFVKVLERACRLQRANTILHPLIHRFIEEVLFEKPVSLFNGDVDHRLGDHDVREHIEATFTPLIRARTTQTQVRSRSRTGTSLSTWKNFQATSTAKRPCVPCSKTLFNLAPCQLSLEAEFVEFCADCSDVVAVAKNAGPQKLMIDYLTLSGRPALYVPDFIVRCDDDSYLLVETKGAESSETAQKARAASEWCKAASTKEHPWRYLYVTQATFEAHSEFTMESLERASRPRLVGLLDSLRKNQYELPLDATSAESREQKTAKFLGDLDLSKEPAALRTAIEQAINQLDFDQRMGHSQFSTAFQPLISPLEALCGAILRFVLEKRIPDQAYSRAQYFDPFLDDFSIGVKSVFLKNQRCLAKNVVEGAFNNRIGNLLFCLGYAQGESFSEFSPGGVWEDVRQGFSAPKWRETYALLQEIAAFRNQFVAHGESPLADFELARVNLDLWCRGLVRIRQLVQAS